MMTAFFDDLERRAPEAREADLFACQPSSKPRRARRPASPAGSTASTLPP
jgi:hypothetical protein